MRGVLGRRGVAYGPDRRLVMDGRCCEEGTGGSRGLEEGGLGEEGGLEEGGGRGRVEEGGLEEGGRGVHCRISTLSSPRAWLVCATEAVQDCMRRSCVILSCVRVSSSMSLASATTRNATLAALILMLFTSDSKDSIRFSAAHVIFLKENTIFFRESQGKKKTDALL